MLCIPGVHKAKWKCLYLHGSWLVLIANVQINFGVIWHIV